MADLTIESIAIEITAAVDDADKALERLSKSLETLKNVCSSGLGETNKVAKGLSKIAAAAHDFDGIDTEKMKSVAEALKSLQSIGTAPDMSKFAQSMSQIAAAANGLNGADMAAFTANIQSFISAVQPLAGLQGVGDLSAAINALKKLPSVAKGLSGIDLSAFAQQMQQITAAIQPFVTQMSNLSSSMSNLPAPVQQAVASLSNYNTTAQQSTQSTTALNKSLKLANITAFYFAAKKVISVLGSFIQSSNDYIENLNLFTVSMGDAADEALNFANKVNSVMGIDISQWIKNQGYFKQLVSGFGMVEEKANLVSQNMTQLGYDKRLSLCGAIHIEEQGEPTYVGCAA